MPQQWWPFKKMTPRSRALVPQTTRPRWTIPLIAGIVLTVGLWLSMAIWLPGDTGVLEVGSPSPDTYDAPRSADFESDLLTAEAQARAENRAENRVFDIDHALPSEQRSEMVGLFDTITGIRTDPSLSERQKQEELMNLPNASMVVSDTLAMSLLALDESDWEAVQRESLNFYDQVLAESRYVIDEADVEDVREVSLPFMANTLPRAQRDLVLFFTSSFVRANKTLDQEATERRKQEARAAVEPVTVSVKKGETIVRDGEIVTPGMIEKLEATGGLPRRLSWLDMGGLAVISGLLSLMYMLYLVFLQREIVFKPRPVFVIVGLVIATAVAARLLIPGWIEFPYAFPMATAVLVLTVVFNSHLALATAAVLGVVLGIIAGDSLSLMITLLVGSGAAVFSVRGAERPLTFLLAGVNIALVTLVAQVGFWLISTPELRWVQLANIGFFSAINGVLSAILALGLFNVVGHIAAVVTPLQLMELAHPSRPLLRKLMREAPGTYSHSVSVGNLAESAAEAVNADALLLRVAAYYHDIGKTLRPYFFTDNQTGRENVHNDLDPQTSAAIIIDHVREGVKMAEAEHLPQPIIDFISTHHGTHTVSHFYQLALRQFDTVDVNDFRYPGPLPFTREQGILMLADSVEATVRAKAQHGQIVAKSVHENGSNGRGMGGPQTLEELVRSIIDDRVRSGQLDNTSLTLRDLVLIRQAFISTLQGIYHPRVEYAQPLARAQA